MTFIQGLAPRLLRTSLPVMCLWLLPQMSRSAEDSLNIKVSGFVDAYYAYDIGGAGFGDRPYTTQPARNNEFNVNLAFLDVMAVGDQLRGRVALQAGTSVQSNYAGEPNDGTISGAALVRHIQEARIGYALTSDTWIDAGIFFSHLGSESWISRDNIVLTRSVVADYSPYYLAGVKCTHAFSDHLSAMVVVANGWQIISENNAGKSVGTSIEYTGADVSLAFNTLFGSEVSPPLDSVVRGSEFRQYYNFIAKSSGTPTLQWIAEVDVGAQYNSAKQHQQVWWGTSLMARYRIADIHYLSLRLEHYDDEDQVIITTGLDAPFRVSGASIGYDVALFSRLLWRCELRYQTSPYELFPASSGMSTTRTTATTSLAVTL